MASKVEIIQTERLLFRGIDESDTNEIVLWRSDPNVFQYFKSPHKITVEEHLVWYRNNYLDNPNRCDWICKDRDSGQKIGVFGLVKTGDVVEVNYLLAPEAQHKGFASEGIRAMVRYSAKMGDVRHVVAEIHRENNPSVTVIKRLGFKYLKSNGDFDIYEIGV